MASRTLCWHVLETEYRCFFIFGFPCHFPYFFCLFFFHHFVVVFLFSIFGLLKYIESFRFFFCLWRISVFKFLESIYCYESRRGEEFFFLFFSFNTYT